VVIAGKDSREQFLVIAVIRLKQANEAGFVGKRIGQFKHAGLSAMRRRNARLHAVAAPLRRLDPSKAAGIGFHSARWRPVQNVEPKSQDRLSMRFAGHFCLERLAKRRSRRFLLIYFARHTIRAAGRQPSIG
jgi:hypothetical protein